MRQAARSDWFDHLFVGVALALALVLAAPAGAQNEATPSDDNSRGVRIIDAPSSAVTAPAPSPAPEAPALAPAPDVPSAPSAATATTAPSPLAPPPAASLPETRPAPPASATLTPPALTPAPSPAAPGAAAPAIAMPPPDAIAALPPRQTVPQKLLTGAELGMLSKSIKVANPAELAVEILPGPELALGSKVSLRITTRKTGYLILVDIDPTGKLTQIYPNPMSLRAAGDRESSNLIRAGKPVQLPNLKDSLSAFEFVASPPSGTAMIVALLSDRPVQMIDLPDVPSTLLASTAAADHLSKLANELRIPDPRGGDAFLEARWSFAAQFYAIR